MKHAAASLLLPLGTCLYKISARTSEEILPVSPVQTAVIACEYSVNRPRSLRSAEPFYPLFSVRIIPTTAAMRTTGAALTNSHSNAWKNIPARAVSGSV